MTYEGEDFERDVEEFAKVSDWRVLGARKYNDDNGTSVAPMFDGKTGKTVTPDLWLMKDGETRWVECKRKDDYFTYRKENIDQHGIDAPNWFDYVSAQKQTGDDVWIFILELARGKVLANKIDDIERTGEYSYDDYESNAAKYENEMVFFRRDSLYQIEIPEPITRLSDVDLNHDYQTSLDLSLREFDLFPDKGRDNGQSGLAQFSDDD